MGGSKTGKFDSLLFLVVVVVAVSSDDGGTVVLRNSSILLYASGRIQLSGGGAPREPVASSADLR